MTNDIFAENAWYFRNALVRANYTNLQKNVHETTEFLKLFLKNLLLNEKNELHNRYMHILWDNEKVDIDMKKVNIDTKKVDIENMISEKMKNFSINTIAHTYRLFEMCGYNKVFGRSMVMEILELKSSGASKFISNLLHTDIIEPVSGYGKGKYKFKK